MLAIYLGDPRVLMGLESIRGRRPAGLRGPSLETLMHQINLEASRVRRLSIAVQVRRNLIGATEQGPAPGQARAHG